MKLFVFALLHLSAVACFSQDVAPTLPISKAAEHAQAQLASLKLGPEYFIRSISLAGNRYEARFEPTVTQRARVGEEPPPIVLKIIVINMDGTTSVEEKTIPRTRSIVRKDTPDAGENMNK